MKIEYSKYCFDEIFIINNLKIDINNKEHQAMINNCFNEIIKKISNDKISFIRDYLKSEGFYEKSVKCDTCGDYNETIKINI